jgi:ABC-type sugar transport system permease subunit
VQNTAVYTFWTVGLTLGGGLAVALLLNRPILPGGALGDAVRAA